MIPEIGIMVGFYILTRNFEILGMKKIVDVLAGASTFVAVIVIADLLLRST